MNFFYPTTDTVAQLPFEVVTCPCNITATDLVEFITSEFPFWGINEFDRQLIYGFGNGVIVAAMNPELALEVFERLQPVNEFLFQLLDQIEEDYLSGTDARVHDSFRYLNVFSQVMAGLAKGLHDWSKSEALTVDEHAWVGFSICLGIMAKQRGLEIAGRQIQHFMRARDEANRFLYLRVLHWADDPVLNLSPMDRYLAYCYRFTSLEGPYIAKLLANFTNLYLSRGESAGTNRLFNNFHLAGKNDARNRPEVLRELIDDINTNLFAGCSKQNAELFQKHIGPNLDRWTPDDVWKGGLSLIREQSPNLLNIKRPAGRIHEIALTQRLLDFAYWSGLYAGRPEAFNTNK